MKKVIFVLLGLILILVSNPVKAIFVCPITPINPIGNPPCSIPPGTITPPDIQFLGTGLITTPVDLFTKGGTLTFPAEFTFRGDGHYNAAANNLNCRWN